MEQRRQVGRLGRRFKTENNKLMWIITASEIQKRHNNSGPSGKISWRSWLLKASV